MSYRFAILGCAALIGCGPTVITKPRIVLPPSPSIPATLKPKPIPQAEIPSDAVQFDPLNFEMGLCFPAGDPEAPAVPCPEYGIVIDEVDAAQYVLNSAAAKRLYVEAEQNHAVANSAAEYTSVLHDWIERDLPDQLAVEEDPWYVEHRGKLGLAAGVLLGGAMIWAGASAAGN